MKSPQRRLIVMKKYRLLLSFCLLLSCMMGYAQSWTGPNPTCPLNSGTGLTYTYSDPGVVWTSASWSVNGGGTIVSGSGLSRNIRFSSPGTIFVTLYNGGTVVSSGSWNVSIISAGTISASPALVCGGSATVTLSSSGYSANLTWESSPDNATWTTLGTGTPSYTVNTSATTWYRAYVSTCKARSVVSNSLQVQVVPLPNAYSMTGGGSYCAGGSGLTVGLSGSQTGVNYQLRRDGANVGSFVSGTGGALAWTGQTSAGTYTVYAYTQAGGCGQNMSGSVGITILPNPTVYTMGGGGSFCPGGSGVSVTLSGSATGVNYQLRLNGSNVGGAVAGTNGALTWTGQTGIGTYTVVATNSSGCSSQMSGSASVANFAVPNVYTVGGGGTMCSTDAGLGVTLSNSQTGVSYQLRVNGSNTGSALNGTGGALTWTNQITAGTYTVIATTMNGCQQTMSGSATIVVNVVPLRYTVSGGGTMCQGASGFSVVLSGSQTGINYQLRIGVTNSGGVVAGTGGALTWPNQTTAGRYSVLATNPTTGCTSTMLSTVDIVVNPLPTAYDVTGTTSQCAGSGGVIVSLSGSQSGFLYQLRLNGTNLGSAIVGTGSGIGWGSITSAGTYTVVATNTATSCIRTMNGSAVLTVLALPTVYTVGGSGTYCASTSVTLNGSQSGVSYQLYRNGVVSGTAVTGTGGALAWNGITTGGNYTVVASNASGCTAPMSGTASIAIDANTVAGSLAPATTTIYSITNSGTLTLSGHTGTVQRWEYSVNGGANWTAISNTTTTYTYTNLNQVTIFRAAVKNASCPELPSAVAQVNAYPAPVVARSQEFIPYGGSSMLSTTSSYATYQWNKDGVAISGATTPTYEAKDIGFYSVTVTGVGTSVQALSSPVEVQSSTRGTVRNLVSTTRILVPGATNTTNLFSYTPEKISQSLNFMDGLGRTVQAVGVGQSPTGKDIVVPTGYNAQGMVDIAYLPYTSTKKDGLFHTDALGALRNLTQGEQYNFYQTEPGITTDVSPYAITVYASSPLLNVKEQGAPGAVWQPGGGRTVKNEMTLNVANDVRYWNDAATFTGYHAANTLAISQVTDENGNKVQTFTDKLGRTILKRVEADGNVEGVTWLETYYLYDTYGRLKYQLPPKAIHTLGTTLNKTATDASIANLIFEYTYDERSRLIAKKAPGKDVEYMVYDKLDRVVLTQDSLLRAAGKWNFVKYDERGRVVYTGWYASTLAQDRLQLYYNSLDYTTQPWFEREEVNATYKGYSNTVFPNTGITVLSVAYYDHYDFDRNGTADYTYDNAHLAGQAATASNRTRGLPTGNTRVTIGPDGNPTANWLYGVTFYDEYDRPIQSQGNNAAYVAGGDKQTTIYDFVKPLKTKTTHRSSASAALDIEDRMEFDAAGRVTKVYRKLGAGAEQLIAQYQYNTLGQLVAKQLHRKGDGSFIQTVDLTYNIRGWLKQINNPAALGSDFFAEELLYNETLGSLNQAPSYNGNISAIKWQDGFGNNVATPQKAFAYNYYKNDQLKEAKYGAGAGYAADTDAFSEQGITYDVNGNLRALTRKGKNAAGAVVNMDVLAYNYAANNPNRLTKVDDSSNNTEGFNNGANTNTELAYDGNGNLKKDENKGISSIVYNHLDKASQVNFTNGRSLKYTYDASGAKIRMEEYNGATLVKTTVYAGGFVYEDNVLRSFASPEGRVVVNGSNYEYQYAIADHQGNTRTLFTSKEETLAFTATYETVASGLRQDTDLFEGLGTAEVSYPTANQTAGGSRVFRMNQTNPSGSGIMLRVYPGDKVDPQVYAYHESNAGYGSTNTATASMITAIAGAFGGVQGAGGESGSIYNMFNEAIGAIGIGPNNGDTKPAAYLNYIFFDEQTGFDKVNQADDAGWKVVPDNAYFSKALVKFDNPIVIKKPGYLYVYLSYENPSNNYVYFDDLKVNYTKGQVVQSTSYYAFGLQTSESWTRIDARPNQYLYNSGSELNAVTGWYETPLRSYDPVLGRMNGVDVMVDRYSSLTPYNYSLNSPAVYSDPSGASAARDYYESVKYASGCGCWRDNGPQDAHAGPGSQSGAHYEAGGDMFGGSWSMLAYGTAYEGGSAFARYGPGDGGALQSFLGNIAEWRNHYAEIAREKANPIQHAPVTIDIDWSLLPDESETTIEWTNDGIVASQIVALPTRPQINPYLLTAGDGDPGVNLGQLVNPRSFNFRKIGKALYTKVAFKETIMYLNTRNVVGMKLLVADLNVSVNLMITARSVARNVEKAQQITSWLFDAARDRLFRDLKGGLFNDNAEANREFIGYLRNEFRGIGSVDTHPYKGVYPMSIVTFYPVMPWP